jgi:hypothetical protein
MLKYLENFEILHDMPKGAILTAWGVKFPGQDDMGYGSMITTDRVAVVEGKKYRVYAACHSNCASYYIIRHGQKWFLR